MINFLGKDEFRTYWVNTSSNSLVGKLIYDGDTETKLIMEDLLMADSLQI